MTMTNQRAKEICEQLLGVCSKERVQDILSGQTEKAIALAAEALGRIDRLARVEEAARNITKLLGDRGLMEVDDPTDSGKWMHYYRALQAALSAPPTEEKEEQRG